MSEQPNPTARGRVDPRQIERAAAVDGRRESLARAEARLREIRAQGGDLDEYRDRLWAPTPPDGWDYQWCVRAVLNQEDPAKHVELQRQGWSPVPRRRHPEMMPQGWTGDTIENGGLVLMERPLTLTLEARERERRAALAAVREKEAQLGMTPKGHIARESRHTGVRKSYEAIAIPDEE